MQNNILFLTGCKNKKEGQTMEKILKELKEIIDTGILPNGDYIDVTTKLYIEELYGKLNISLEPEVIVQNANGLIPCPFCGSKEVRTWQKSDGYWNIQCNDKDANCTAMIYDFDTRDEAMNHWNYRASILSK